MKILPVSLSQQYTNFHSFKGLWGKKTYDSHTESEYYISDTRYEYYPFSDETEEQIKTVKEKTENYKQSVPGQGFVADPWPHIDGIIVTVMAALPFTSKEFTDYTMNKLSDVKRKIIEENIFTKKLTVMKK